MWMASRRTSNDRRLFLALVGILIGLSWLALWAWGSSPYGRYLSHHSLEDVRGDLLLALVFAGGWTLMVMAMMLPTSLPLVALFHTITRGRTYRWQLVALLLAGYLGVWTLFGAAVYAADSVLHEAAERSAWLEAHAWTIGAATLVAAGIYQFTPLKYLCLDECRSPMSFILEHWRGGQEHGQALRLGVHHGLFCLGCCWTLMLLMLAVGVGSLGWMLVLATVMAVGKNVSWGRRLNTPLGVALIAWGLVVGATAMLQ